jgi:hypothetical protein
LLEQFSRSRDGDRFWFRNVFTPEEQTPFLSVSLADVILRNMPGLSADDLPSNASSFTVKTRNYTISSGGASGGNGNSSAGNESSGSGGSGAPVSEYSSGKAKATITGGFVVLWQFLGEDAIELTIEVMYKLICETSSLPN